MSPALGRRADGGKRQGTGQGRGRSRGERQEKRVPEAYSRPLVLVVSHRGAGGP
jgi:hypothetical protein